jgi:hypothetical protein
LEGEVSTWSLFKHIIHLPCWKDADAEAKMDALFKSSSPSGGEHQGLQESETEESFEGEEGLEDEDAAPRVKSKNAFKAKKGVIARDQISAAVAAMSDDGQDDRTSIRTARFDFPIHCHLITNLTRSLFNALGGVGSSQPPA